MKMTKEELQQYLERASLPVARGEFKKIQAPPFITYDYAYSSDMYADNHNYCSIANYDIELFRAEGDDLSEQLLEELFRNTDLPYEKQGSWLREDRIRQTVYTIKIVEG